MITPTGVTASEYWDAIKAGNTTHARITFLGQNIVLTDDDIDHSIGIQITDIFNDDVDLVFGKAVCKQLETSIINSDRLSGLVWTGEFSLEFGVEINGVTNWVTIGYFSGEKPNNVTTVPTIEFTAYDRMIRFNQLADNFVKTITYPTTIQNIYNGLCTFVGVDKVSGNELPNIMNRSYSSAPVEMKGYTCRDVLAWIAEACGCYATITEAGKVRMCWFTSTTHAVTGSEEFSVESDDMNNGMTWNEADAFTWNEIDNLTWNDVCGYQEEYAIDRIVIKQIDNDLDVVYPTGMSDGNTYMIVGNPFLSIGNWSDVTNYIVPLYNRLDSFGGYFPVVLDCIGNWCIEAGDIITVDVNEFTISVPIFMKVMRWNGFTNDEYTTTGQKVRDAYTTDANKRKILTANEIRLSAPKIISEAVEEAVDEALDSADSRYIHKTTQYQDVASIINTAESYTDGELGNYIQKTTQYQDVASIINSAEDYTDGRLTSYSTTQQTATAISQYVTNNAYGKTSGITIDANGVEITGSKYLKLTSGSTFDVDATNFKIDSANKYVRTGEWELQQRGLLCKYYDSGDATDVYLLFGRVGYIPPDNTKPIVGLQSQVVGKSGSKYNASFDHSIRQPNGDGWAGIDFTIYPNLPGVSISAYDDSDLQMINNIGNSASKWDVYGRIIHYTSLIQDSSRDVKHDIQGMQSVGDKLDRLIPVTYIYDDDETESRRPGLIYEDAIDVMPEICTGDEGNKGISYIELIPMLLKEIQDLRARVKTLEER